MTDYAAEGFKLGTLANDEVAGLRADLLAASGSLADKDRTIAGLQDSLAQVSAEFTAYKAAHPDTTPPPPPPPPPPTTLVTGSSTALVVPGYAKVRVARTYLGAGQVPSTYSADSGLSRAVSRASEAVWVSFKDKPGTWLDSLLTSLRATGLTVILTQNHEPENDGMTPAQIAEYHADWQTTQVIADGHAHVLTASILMGGKTRAEWDLYYPKVALDLCGFDRYNPGIQTATKYVTPATVFAGVIAYAKEKGLPLAIGETGTNIVAGDAAGRAKWAADARKVLADAGAAYACWWSQGACVLDSATATAWLR